MRAVLIAAKELAFAKTRLRLPAEQRRALAAAMFHDVLAAALGAARPARVAVVSSDPTLLAAARAGGALAIDEAFPRGLNAAVALATGKLVGLGATTLCTLLSDTPLISAADIDRSFDSMGAGQGVLLVPSHDGQGTNILVRRPPTAIATHFGRSSLARHRAQCAGGGIACQVLELAGPALDIDELADLQAFARLAASGRTVCEVSHLELAIT